MVVPEARKSAEWKAVLAAGNGRGGGGVSSGPGFGRSGTMGRDRVDTGRGPSMYEMEGPRPASRHRPADFSASFAPLGHLPGPGTLPVFRSTGTPGGSGAPRAVAQAFLFANEPGFPPAGWRRIFPSPWLRAFFHRMTGVSPKPKGSSFLFAGGSELSSHYATRGCPSAAQLEVFSWPMAQSFLLRT
jgi:hypothetical protein